MDKNTSEGLNIGEHWFRSLFERAPAVQEQSNYTNHLTSIPLDTAFAGEAWQATDEHACCAAAA